MPRQNQRRAILGAALGLGAVIVLSVSAGVSYVSANRWVDHTLEVQKQADEWTIALLESGTAVRGYVVSGQPDLLAPYDVAARRERVEAAIVRGLVVDNPVQAQNVEAADHTAQVAMKRFRELVALMNAGRREEALALVATGDGQRTIDAFRVDAQRIRAEEDERLVARRSRVDALALAALLGGLLLVLVSIALLVVASTLQARRAELLEKLGREARLRLEALSEIASALAAVRTRTQVAEVVVDQGMRIAGADTCTLYMLDEAGLALELIGDRGVAPEVIGEIRRLTETSGNPQTFATLRSGEAIWVETASDYVARFPAIAKVKTEGPRAEAFWSMPLIVEGRPVGLVGMGFYGPRKFPVEERAFVETFTKQCAQALLRATHLEREDEARRWFAVTLRSIGDAVIATDPDGRVTFVNAVAERLTGWRDDEARGRNLDEVFCILSEQTRKAAESPVAKVLREGKVVGLANHTVLRSKDGKESPIDDSAAPILDEGGRLFGVVLVFRDVTGEKREQVRRDFMARAGEALVSSLDYRTTLSTVAHLAVPELADWCSVEIVETAGKPPQQVAVAHVDPAKMHFARELGERYPPNPDAPMGAPEVIRTGKSQLYSEIPPTLLEARAQDAEHLRIIRDLKLESAMVVPLKGHVRTLGAMTFVYAESGRRYSEADLAFAEDFARRAAMALENAMAMKEVEDARAREHRLRGEAEIANRAKDEFLATVSHELRTPLNAILGWTLTLRGRKQEPEVDRPLAIIERNARAQTKLIEDVLDVSRIISGKLVLNLGSTSLAEAVEASIETVTPAAAAKRIAISASVEDRSLTIVADMERLQQVVWNLLTNAVKFTPKDGEVSLRAYREGSEICISVRDTGEGIRPEALPLVFEPFQQADASTTRRHGGLGLGLAIVKHIVTAHGGTVHADSDGEGKGATFVVRLPARSAVPALGARATPAGARPSPRLDGLRILVIDDEEDARMLVAAVLCEQGADVHVAGSAADALEKLALVRPDVVVSDIGMPLMDGYSLIQKIRALPPALGGRTPAVALTAYARAEDAQRAFAAGYQMHVAKPIEPSHLATVVANLGGRSQPPPL
jgi:PAS domain S-box-containing protein